MKSCHSQKEIRELLGDIIEGRIVKRSKHSLTLDSSDLSSEFVRTLQAYGYDPTVVQDVTVAPGERVPAFHIDRDVAYFGWVFWEKFTESRMRKLFGSVVRNEKGDWAVQIGARKGAVIYANMALKSSMDIDNPSGF